MKVRDFEEFLNRKATAEERTIQKDFGIILYQGFRKNLGGARLRLTLVQPLLERDQLRIRLRRSLRTTWNGKRLRDLLSRPDLRSLRDLRNQIVNRLLGGSRLDAHRKYCSAGLSAAVKYWFRGGLSLLLDLSWALIPR